jgi:hypothetical protein
MFRDPFRLAHLQNIFINQCFISASSKMRSRIFAHLQTNLRFIGICLKMRAEIPANTTIKPMKVGSARRARRVPVDDYSNGENS